MPKARVEFATEVDSEILASVLAIAKKESRQLQVLVEEALADLIEKRERTRPRPHVLAAYLGSYFQYDELYKKLAK